MVEYIFTFIFIIVFLILALLSKKHLYADEHEKSIEKELKDFDENFNAINRIDLKSNFKLG